MNKNIQAIYPLTSLQEGILYHTIEMQNSDIYFQQFSCVLEGLKDANKWQQSWQQVAQSHPAMRTLFAWKNQAKPLQIVRNKISLPWHELDWQTLESSQQTSQWASLTLRDRDANFDLSTAPLTRFTLVNLGNNRYYFLFSFHHIILDGWSQRLLFDQAIAHYNNAQSTHLGQYDYSTFIDYLAHQDKDAAKTFWTTTLAGFKAPTNIVNDSSTQYTTVDNNNRSTQELSISNTLLEKLNAQARQHHLTLNSLILGAWSLILASHNRTNDVLFGTTVAGRPIDLPNADKIAGLFINTLPFRAKLNPQATLAESLAAMQSSQAACRQYEQTPITDIQRYSELSAGTSLFESIVVVENLPSAKDENRNEFTIVDPQYKEFSHYPLAILVDPSEGLNLIAVHQESKISTTRAKDVLAQLQSVITQMSLSLDTPIANVNTLADAHRQQIADWNNTQHCFTDIAPVHQLFEKWAETTPNKKAIIDLSGTQALPLTYAQVNKRANQLARYILTKQQFSSNDVNNVVPIILERNANALIAYLAVMKAGAAYIPIDAEQPSQRIAAIIDSIQNDNLLVISQQSLQEKTSVSASNLLLLDAIENDITNVEDHNLSLGIAMSQLAYVIYTSGSTGVPKGVMIEHKALANSTLARNEFYTKTPDTFLLLSSLATDSSIAGIYWTLSTGNTLVLPAKRIEQDMAALGRVIQEHKVTHTLCIPSLYQLILEHCDTQNLAGLSTVIVAGESCNQSVINRHQKSLRTCDLYNEYGPSECCVWATGTSLNNWQPSTEVFIGSPICNTQTYVLDNNLQPVLPNVIGDLFIGGDNLARGYLHQEGKTAEAFVSKGDGNENSLYKTGDLVKQTTSGELVFVGRSDNQVKLRGFRIEPEEIEHALCAHSAIEEALVYVESPDVSDTVIVEALLALDDTLANSLLSDHENQSEEGNLGPLL